MKTKNYILILIAVIFSAITLTASRCSKENKTQDISQDISINFNESKEVAIGGNNINVSFTTIEDNRVPLSECAMSYGSRANIEIIFAGENIPLQIFGCNTDGQGNILDNPEYIDTLGYRINAYKLEPYPSGTQINESDYVLKLKIEKL